METEHQGQTRTGMDSDTALRPPREHGTDEPGAQTPGSHPLADLLGKYEGEAWEAVLEAIEENRAQQAAAEADEAA
jgi:hypothetical protein